jgi:hypothetical protein
MVSFSDSARFVPKPKEMLVRAREGSPEKCFSQAGTIAVATQQTPRNCVTVVVNGAKPRLWHR